MHHTCTVDVANVANVLAVRGTHSPRPPHTHAYPPTRILTVRDGALEIAFKKFAGDSGADFLGEIRNRL